MNLCVLPLSLLALLFSHLSHAATVQHLVDDIASNIQYNSKWNVSSSDLDYGGSLHYANSATASATFNFTGIAVEFLAPKWSSLYSVHTMIQLDGGSWDTVNLVNSSSKKVEGSDAPTTKYSTVWSKDNLSNGPHVINVKSTGETDDYTIIDAFRYTELVDDSSSDNSSMIPNPAATPTPSPVQHSLALSSNERIGAIVGGTLGAVTIIALVLFLFIKRRRKPAQKYNNSASAALPPARPRPKPTRPTSANAGGLRPPQMSYGDMRSTRTFVAAPVTDGSYSGPSHFSYIRGTSWDSPDREKQDPFNNVVVEKSTRRPISGPLPLSSNTMSSYTASSSSTAAHGEKATRNPKPPTAAAGQLKRATMSNLPRRHSSRSSTASRGDRDSWTDELGRVPSRGRNQYGSSNGHDHGDGDVEEYNPYR
ncbi:hypothetical protein DL96DRAFT_1613719 [Flagelloscypha sp. PMI_526]|nr:hypothetical protein DL96DRAFT_1613719 [Flagelloscypha sp. PMI_526]